VPIAAFKGTTGGPRPIPAGTAPDLLEVTKTAAQASQDQAPNRCSFGEFKAGHIVKRMGVLQLFPQLRHCLFRPLNYFLPVSIEGWGLTFLISPASGIVLAYRVEQFPSFFSLSNQGLRL